MRFLKIFKLVSKQIKKPWMIDELDVCLDDSKYYQNSVRKSTVVYHATYKNEVGFAAKSIALTFRDDKRLENLMDTIWKAQEPRSEFLVKFVGALNLGTQLLCVCELAPQSLRQHLFHERAIDGVSLNALAKCIANGLSHLHRKGICHGLLSSSNVLIWPSDDPLVPPKAKLIDYAMYLVYEDCNTDREAYVPPEAKMAYYNISEVGYPGDVYSFGNHYFQLHTEVPNS